MVENSKTEYPLIFVHGMFGWGENEGINRYFPYWGTTACNLKTYLTDNGIECYEASVGPMSSAWDQACELYAQLKGTRVDYGKAHSDKHKHKQYGRIYTKPLFEGWSNEKKVHLIGHSFGGTTIRLLVHLLTYGSPEEQAVTDSNDLSGLFTGGKDDWVKSVTTICAPHNSSSVYYPLKYLGIYDIVRNFSYLYAAVLGRSYLNGRMVDFHLEQFGLTDIPGEGGADNLFEAMYRAETNNQDLCIYDLSPAGSKVLNDKIEINDDVYYFSYAFSTTQKTPVVGFELPKINTNPVIYLTSLVMALMPEFKDPETGVIYNDDWRANDALVNTESEKYPLDEPYTEFDSENINKGIWNVMPVREGDHGKAIGLFADEETVHSYFLEVCEMLCNLPD